MAVSGLVSGPRGRRRPQGRAQPLGDQMLAGAQEGGPQLGRGGEVAEHFRQVQECAGPVSVLAHGVQEPVAQRVGQLPGVGAGALEVVEALAQPARMRAPCPTPSPAAMRSRMTGARKVASRSEASTT